MKALFLDCNDQLAPVWQKVVRPDDPAIDVNRRAYPQAELPQMLKGYQICIDDHSYLPTELVDRCDALKHVVFLGTGPASYMSLGDLADRGIKVHTIRNYGDTAVAEHTIALVFAACREVARMDREVRAGTWVPHEGVQLLGKTLGVKHIEPGLTDAAAAQRSSESGLIDQCSARRIDEDDAPLHPRELGGAKETTGFVIQG